MQIWYVHYHKMRTKDTLVSQLLSMKSMVCYVETRTKFYALGDLKKAYEDGSRCPHSLLLCCSKLNTQLGL